MRWLHLFCGFFSNVLDIDAVFSYDIMVILLLIIPIAMRDKESRNFMKEKKKKVKQVKYVGLVIGSFMTKQLWSLVCKYN